MTVTGGNECRSRSKEKKWRKKLRLHYCRSSNPLCLRTVGTNKDEEGKSGSTVGKRKSEQMAESHGKKTQSWQKRYSGAVLVVVVVYALYRGKKWSLFFIDFPFLTTILPWYYNRHVLAVLYIHTAQRATKSRTQQKTTKTSQESRMQ